MRLEYDSKYNVAYIRFLEDPAENLQTLNISAELNIDMTADGHLYGIELLDANESAWSKKFKNPAFGDETSEILEKLCNFCIRYLAR